MQGFMLQLKRLSAAQWTFVISLLLSGLAVHFQPVIGKDAAFYLDISQHFLDQGLASAFSRFDWPWFPVLIGASHAVTGIGLETVAFLWCGLFMAGACALMVDLVVRRLPGSGSWACLVILAMPAFNAFRGEILREFGFWFFSVLTLWCALRWRDRGGWLGALGIQGSIGLAALFRFEAVLLMPALVLWLVPGLRTREGWGRMTQLVLLPLCAAIVVALLLGSVLHLDRIENFLSMIDPQQVFSKFNAVSDRLGSTVLMKYSADDAGKILVFGMLGVTLLMFTKLLGPFVIPFLTRTGWRGARASLGSFDLFAWTWLCYLLVLMFFFVQQLFINSRYASFLDWLAVPLVVAGVYAFAQRFPRTGKALAAVAMLMMLANVISLSAKKTHYIDAGHWVAEHVEPGASIYYSDPRIGYYAGRGYEPRILEQEEALGEAGSGKFTYLLIEAKPDDAAVTQWLAANGKVILAQFSNKKKATVLVLGPAR
ncbi:hypothetical protein PHLH8_54560 [Pseudomonas sp. Pc102]|uniref:ArnT family glycosyltransferase n=1 Tax=Pseudomonas sp. Pc102 TaxID=2678261 RepID=UPI001BCF6FCB|nr:hypothetical protein [Pseudomonas sp. Pc102]BBP85814.1 hypothetical protein PHLH8_54560 [Pseudomonas sp. Pc102]